jgi:hypothetical protein
MDLWELETHHVLVRYLRLDFMAVTNYIKLRVAQLDNEFYMFHGTRGCIEFTAGARHCTVTEPLESIPDTF